MTNNSNITPGVVVGLPPEVITIITRPLDASKGEVKQDAHRNGERFMPKYPPAQVVIRRLNEAFGHGWSDEVVSINLAPDWSEVLVHTRLRVHSYMLYNGAVSQLASPIVHDGIGRAYLKRTPQGGLCDYGNDVKAAHTDGIRKAATKLGFSLELYDRDESHFQGMDQTGQPAQDLATQTAPGFQVQQVVGIFESQLSIPRATWLAALGLNDPANMTTLVAQQVIAKTHPAYVFYYQYRNPQAQPPAQHTHGLRQQNA